MASQRIDVMVPKIHTASFKHMNIFLNEEAARLKEGQINFAQEEQKFNV